jgi:hypothetical protein
LRKLISQLGGDQLKQEEGLISRRKWKLISKREPLISTERISWGGGLFSHRKRELRDLISQRREIVP